MTKNRPYFLWDYDLSEDDVHKILRTGTAVDKNWMLSRILESAKYQDVWKYTTLSEVRAMMPVLKIKKPIRRAWEYALSVWQ
ncbi:hypothetical protein HZB69_02250 [Candidatus Amesbacteria bacterium]|nr:hypothetical protein [Candidatus Amesbacteria bacterium]